MAVPRNFILGNKKVSPFVVAPWLNDPAEQLSNVSNIIRYLRGEWPCFPFGSADAQGELPPDWEASRRPDPNWHRDSHGYGANSNWSLKERSVDKVVLSINYPEDHPVKCLERTITCCQNSPSVYSEVRCYPRLDATIPMGFHPVMRLPSIPGRAKIVLSKNSRAWTFPVEVEPGKAALAADQRDRPLIELQGTGGGRFDPTCLPWELETEDLILVTGTEGQVRLENYDEGYAVTLNWDEAALPSLMLWISNRGRASYPWNARFRGLGMEPVCAPFDLGPAFSDTSTPLALKGIPTGIRLKAGYPWTAGLYISVTSL